MRLWVRHWSNSHVIDPPRSGPTSSKSCRWTAFQAGYAGRDGDGPRPHHPALAMDIRLRGKRHGVDAAPRPMAQYADLAQLGEHIQADVGHVSHHRKIDLERHTWPFVHFRATDHLAARGLVEIRQAIYERDRRLYEGAPVPSLRCACRIRSRHIRQRCDIAVVGAGAGNDAFRFDPMLPNQHGGHPRGSSHDPRDFCAISHLDLIAMAESEESLHCGMVRRHPLRVWCCTALTRDLLIAGRSSSISRRDSHPALHAEALLNLQPSRSIASLSPARRCKR